MPKQRKTKTAELPNVRKTKERWTSSKKKRQIEKEKRLRAELKAINEKIAFSDKFSKKHAKN